MKKILLGSALALVLAGAAGPLALAQPASAPAPGFGASQGMGPGGMGMGMGPHGMAGKGPGARGMGPRYGAGVTPGWSMMTPEERTAHQAAMRNAKTYEECVAVRDQHHTDMAARAQAKGASMPAAPRRDVCAGLPKK